MLHVHRAWFSTFGRKGEGKKERNRQGGGSDLYHANPSRFRCTDFRLDYGQCWKLCVFVHWSTVFRGNFKRTKIGNHWNWKSGRWFLSKERRDWFFLKIVKRGWKIISWRNNFVSRIIRIIKIRGIFIRWCNKYSHFIKFVFFVWYGGIKRVISLEILQNVLISYYLGQIIRSEVFSKRLYEIVYMYYRFIVIS